MIAEGENTNKNSKAGIYNQLEQQRQSEYTLRYAILVNDMLDDFVHGKLRSERAKDIIPHIRLLLQNKERYLFFIVTMMELTWRDYLVPHTMGRCRYINYYRYSHSYLYRTYCLWSIYQRIQYNNSRRWSKCIY